jgi:triosephosphate isomerase
MRIPIIAGNWKMHKTRTEGEQFVIELRNFLPGETRAKVVLCPPFTALGSIVELVKGCGWGLGAQNLYWQEEGAFTGEISARMLGEIGCDYVIVGHSERRGYFGETNEDTGKKVVAAHKYGICPILCVGESLEQREKGETLAVVQEQVAAGLRDLTPQQAAYSVIAYEPIWAIGTGRSSKGEDAQEVAKSIRETIGEKFGGEAAQKVRILYGGSVNPENIAEFREQKDIDGALVGGASLQASSFSKIIMAYQD